jgi:hypothetical protein
MSQKLCTEPRILDQDDFYARLIALHEGLSSDESHSLNCKLILLMANHIGEQEALDDLLEIGWNYRPQK